MGIKTFGSGFDPNSGWAPDDSTGIPWQDDVELPGQFRGGGQGYGPGGFSGNPRLTAPATGRPPGISISGEGGGGSAIHPDEVMPPTNRTIPLNKSAVPFRGWSAGDAAMNLGRRFLPKIIGKRIPGVDFITPSDELAPPAMDEAPPWSFQPGGVRPVPRPWGEPSPSTAGEPMPPIVKGPVPVGLPMPGAAYRPEDSPSFTAPNPYGAGMPRPGPGDIVPPPQRGMPWAGNNAGRPAGVGAPAGGAAAPVAAPAAAAQRPDLGTYNPFTTFDRPNMSPQNSAYGHQGATQMGMLDLSHLFGGGQPAAAPAAATVPLPPPRPRGGVLSKPSKQLVEPGPEDPSIIAQQRKRRNLGGGHF